MPPRLVYRQYCLQLRHSITHTKPPSFSTSSAPHAQIPPESPNFIQIPRLVQPHQPFPLQIKGVLPYPRRIFPRFKKSQHPKASPAYLDAVVPEPLRPKTAPDTDGFMSWKARQSEQRRRNLREGLTELHQRMQETGRRKSQVAAQNRRVNEKLLYASERRDVFLTSPSVLTSQRPRKRRPPPESQRAAQLAVMRQNVADMAAMREENRRNDLHTLYVNAGDFIMTSEQLDRVVDRTFDDNSQFRSENDEGVNVWNLGFPETAQQLLNKVNNSGKRTALESATGSEIVMVTRERMRKISEELTGGKMLEER